MQGCDVWLNNPRKPLEASGTSGMKAAINGVPHLSIGDGWWAEGFNGANGWVIDGGEPSDNYDAVDAADAEALYRLLEEEVVPAFYDRDAGGVPRRWVAIVKESIRSVAPRFSARRMVKEYVEQMYVPALALERKVVNREVVKSSHPDSDLPADRRMVDDLDLVAIRIAEVARPRAVAMRARLRVQRDAAALQKRCPAIDVLGRSHDQPEMIERRRCTDASRRREAASRREPRERCSARLSVPDDRYTLSAIGLPLDREAQEIDVEPLHRVEIARR